MTTSQREYTLEQGDPNRPPTGRPVVYATQGVISSGHYLTSMAGMRMLLSGGNAFDALVAAGFAAAVVEPIASYSLAAEGVFMLYHAESGDLLSLSGQGTAPGKATVDFFKSQGLGEIPTGPGSQAHLSFTVPGVVDAFLALLERYGTRTLGEVLAPSIHYAEYGIPNYEYMLERMKNQSTKDQFDLYPPGGRDIFYDNGSVPQPGSMLVQPGLADVFKRMVAAENAGPGHRREGIRAARDAFYKGDIAQSIVECAQRVGGILSLEDLAGYHAEFEEPLSTSFMGHEIYGQSVWTQGPVLMQTLSILEHFDLKDMGHNSPAYIHTVAEATKLALADREAYYGDPNFSTIPVDGLLSKEYAAERASLIDLNKATPDLPPAGDPWKYSKASRPQTLAASPVGSVGDGSGDDSGTTHVSVLDRDGNMVCATPSGGGFAKSVFFPELGCALSTRIEMLNFEEGHPNALMPNKRPRTTLINYMITKDGQPIMTVGCPGADHQAQANVQLVLNTLVFGMNPQESIEARRFATDTAVNSFFPHTHYPGQLSLESGIPASTADALKALGHQTKESAVCGMGATVSHRDPNTGVLSTGGDPRRACYAIGW
ncbi:MAG: gamma-glutamyltransferase family protein [Chloroflexi bacterium]|nr:gamma-glutamyltransferase family protein [Chloroflexota bacterium]